MHLNESNHFKIVVFKITKQCNAKCKYCYEEKNYNENLQNAFNILQKIDETNTLPYELIFHGGEPLLKINEILEYKNKLKNVKQFSLQTNGILLKSNLYEHLKDFNIGVSLDSFETDLRNTNITNQQIFENITKARDNNLSVGVLITLSRDNIDKNVFLLLDKLLERGITNIKINNLFHIDNNMIPSIYDIERFWNKFYKYKKYFNEENSKLIENRVLQKNFDVPICNSQFCGAGKHIIAIEPDGKIKPCGRFSEGQKFYNKYAGVCNICLYKTQCMIGCKAWASENQLYFKNECMTNQTIIKLIKRKSI